MARTGLTDTKADKDSDTKKGFPLRRCRLFHAICAFVNRGNSSSGTVLAPNTSPQRSRIQGTNLNIEGDMYLKTFSTLCKRNLVLFATVVCLIAATSVAAVAAPNPKSCAETLIHIPVDAAPGGTHPSARTNPRRSFQSSSLGARTINRMRRLWPD